MSISYDVPEGYEFVDGVMTVSLGQAVTEGEATDIVFVNIERAEGSTLTVPVGPQSALLLTRSLVEALRLISEGDDGDEPR